MAVSRNAAAFPPTIFFRYTKAVPSLMGPLLFAVFRPSAGDSPQRYDLSGQFQTDATERAEPHRRSKSAAIFVAFASGLSERSNKSRTCRFNIHQSPRETEGSLRNLHREGIWDGQASYMAGGRTPRWSYRRSRPSWNASRSHGSPAQDSPA